MMRRLKKSVSKRLSATRVIRELKEWTDRDQEMVDFYSALVKPDQLVFDVGANIGRRTKIFLNLGAKVIAVEPQDTCAKIIRKAFKKNRKLTVINEALGEESGEAQMMICDANTISSVSKEWIDAVKKSGRFSLYNWNESRTVPMTTLDRLIRQFGKPSFIKIDVEGFEYQVLKGLSEAIDMISFEFTPELLESTLRCIDYLRSLGPVRLNFALGQEMKLILREWSSPDDVKLALRNLKSDNSLFGDVYARSIR